MTFGSDTRSLIQALKRNSRRFPADFVFQLTKHEFDSLRSQIVISKGEASVQVVRVDTHLSMPIFRNSAVNLGSARSGSTLGSTFNVNIDSSCLS